MILDFRLPPPGEKLEPRQSFLLWHLPWEDYEKIVEALNEQHVRVTYHRGDVELMSTLPVHEMVRIWFSHFMLAMMQELDISFKNVGQTTLRRRNRNCGLEPDDSYYFANRLKVVDWATLNLDRDPPPELVLELDLTRTCVDRMNVYAGLDVREVWRFDGDSWHVHILVNGSYEESPISEVFPFLPLTEIVPLMRQSLYTRDDRERIIHLTRWARERVTPLLEEWRQHYDPRPHAGNP